MCIVGGRSGRKFPRWTEDSVHSPDKVGIFDLKSRLSRDLRLKVEITERAKPCRDPSALEFQNGKNSPTLQCFRILRLRSGQARVKQRSCSLQGCNSFVCLSLVLSEAEGYENTGVWGYSSASL